MSSDDIIYHTFTIENNIRRLSEDVNSVHNILACRTDGKSDVERHKKYMQDGGEEGKRRQNGWLRHGRALIKRASGWLQRVIGVFLLGSRGRLTDRRRAPTATKKSCP